MTWSAEVACRPSQHENCSSPQHLWLCDSSAAAEHVSLGVVTAMSQPPGSPFCLEISPSGVFLSSVGIFAGNVPAEMVQQVAEVRLADRCSCRELQLPWMKLQEKTTSKISEMSGCINISESLSKQGVHSVPAQRRLLPTDLNGNQSSACHIKHTRRPSSGKKLK